MRGGYFSSLADYLGQSRIQHSETEAREGAGEIAEEVGAGRRAYGDARRVRLLFVVHFDVHQAALILRGGLCSSSNSHCGHAR